METIKSLIRSSQNPAEVSLFVKSFISFALLFGFDSTVINEAGGQITSLIVGLGMIVSALTGLYGLGRKATLGRWSAPTYTKY